MQCNLKAGVLYWITGLPGAGKTTIGLELYYELKKKGHNVVILDGDVLLSIFSESGFSVADRYARAQKYAKLCKVLTDQGLTVVCCTIAMFDEVRAWNRENIKRYVEIYLKVSDVTLQKRDYKKMYSLSEDNIYRSCVPGNDVCVELPTNADIIIENDGERGIKECVKEILEFDTSFVSNFDRDVNYWNNFYSALDGLKEPSYFAKTILGRLQSGKKLLELGCGNGRDSLYFWRNNIVVTAVDASDEVINELSTQYKDENIQFLCDDFVSAKTIYKKEYDYCYSRFSLHAINENQENELFENVYQSLVMGGFFFIEVRSVNDEIFGLGKKVGRNAYLYNGHFRRFIVLDELVKKLKVQKFKIITAEENRGYAPFADDDPMIIRVIAKKTSG